MAMIGYARVRSGAQSLAVQLDKLQDCDPIFQEKRSGTSDKRPQLAACLQYVRRGDTLVVTKLDRLARSTLHLCQLPDPHQQNPGRSMFLSGRAARLPERRQIMGLPQRLWAERKQYVRTRQAQPLTHLLVG